MAVDVREGVRLVRSVPDRQGRFREATAVMLDSEGDRAWFAEGVAAVLWWAGEDVDFGPASKTPDLPVELPTVLDERAIFAERVRAADTTTLRRVHATGALSAIDWLMGLKDHPLDGMP